MQNFSKGVGDSTNEGKNEQTNEQTNERTLVITFQKQEIIFQKMGTFVHGKVLASLSDRKIHFHKNRILDFLNATAL